MAKRSTKAKRSLASLPKGLPSKSASFVNPFEVIKGQGSRRVKHEVNNRFPTSSTTAKSLVARHGKLAESLQRRQSQQRAALHSSKKANSFVDRRIGEFTMSQEDKIMARIVKERSSRSKRLSKYALNEEGDNHQEKGKALLTHKGRAINTNTFQDHIILDSDEEDGGDLDAIDTEMNFGGGTNHHAPFNPYGPSDVNPSTANMSHLHYAQKKNDLDEMIARRKRLKAERMFAKEQQEEVFESLDQGFDELAQLLQFRDKEKDRKIQQDKKKLGQFNQEELEMADWDREMKSYLFERKVKATDRTKTPEELAKEEADRLHELETRRLARMHGDFEHDDLSDISDNDQDKSGVQRKRRIHKKPLSSGAEALDDSDEEVNDEKWKVKFTSEGLVYLDKDGKIVKKVGDCDQESNDQNETNRSNSNDETESHSSDNSNDEHDVDVVFEVGTRVKAIYRADEQYDGYEAWHEGKVAQVLTDECGNVTYDIDYDDGDYEDGVKPENVRAIKGKKTEKDMEAKGKEVSETTKRKRQKAKERARGEIPFVFEVPTTLESLHEMIGNHASTGAEASLIIDRIHASNSVRLNKKNLEKMQNFYDVLLRRFIAVGDAIYVSGNGGEELNRHEQLNALTRTLFAMTCDAPESTAAVWGRRLGVFQNAHAKRLRDAEFVQDEDEVKTSWPSSGTIMLLRALAHIFPVTDRRHSVVTPALILLCQIVAQTPINCLGDVVSGLLCCGLLIEYTREAKRVVPEALAFLSGVLRLFSSTKPERSCFPTMKKLLALDLRSKVSKFNQQCIPMLSMEQAEILKDSTPVAVLCSALHLIDQCVQSLGGTLEGAETEAFGAVANALLELSPQSKTTSLPGIIADKIILLASKLAHSMPASRIPLTRRSGPSRLELSIKSLAPRLEDPSRYRMSRDEGKSTNQAALDRSRREYKREHKAVARELRMDGAFAEQERRREQDKRDSKARAKRHKNLAWLESEQGAMNQQVAQGGGLLSGGGMGAARAKARSARLGIKKGGKF